MSATIRVLIVDDSAFARKVLRAVLEKHTGIEVIGSARDGLEALEKIVDLKPDVVTLDLVMPNLDGIGLLRSLPPEHAPRVVIVSVSDALSAIAIEALELGAVDLVRKPTALATDQLYDLERELVLKVRAAALAKKAPPVPVSQVARAPAIVPQRTRLVVVGASTGGPNAITRLLTALPKHFPVPIVIALHIPAGYTDALAARLNEQCELEVREASEGLTLVPGQAVLAKGGQHLVVRKSAGVLQAHLTMEPLHSLYFPSINLLFESAVNQLGDGVLGVVLTGMGDDGLRGASLIRKAGGEVLTEAESSCVIYGMPRTVVEAGYSSAQAPIDQMARTVVEHLR